MLGIFKTSLSKIFSIWDYELRPKVLHEISDDPMFVLSRIFDPEKVNLIIDAGASIGDTSQKLSNLFPNADVHAFEPFPEFVDALQQKAIVNPKIKVQPFALGEKNGTCSFHVNESKGTNSLLKPREKSREVYGSLMESEGVIEVHLKRLDDWVASTNIQKVDILKLDLQGGELSALQGATELLQKGNISSILCEVMFEKAYQEQPSWIELVSLIEKSGFRLFNAYHKHHHIGQILQADVLFIQPSIIEASEKKRRNSFHKFSKIIIS